MISSAFHSTYVRSLFVVRPLCLYFVFLKNITSIFQKFHFDYEKNEFYCGYRISKNTVFCDVITENISSF
ncbi:hypothetical protein BWD13_19900 [Leptospira santarosai serovar Grippotyphosa]|nr:hypothetical protein BWD13_19900 [Leptospira santarosai serovar Grippotyphosa]